MHKADHIVHTFGRNGNYSKSFARNSIAQATAINTCQTRLEVRNSFFQKTEHHFIGITTLQVNINTRVTTFESGQRHFQRHITFFYFHFGVAKANISINTTGTTNIKLTLILRIHIDQNVAFQKVRLQAKSTEHARFFIYSNKHFDGRMRNISRLHDRHGCSQPNTIVGT